MNADTSEYDDFYYASADGLRLHAQIYGSQTPERLPVICLPGLTRNTRDFHELALYLSRDTVTPRQVISFDYRGRGKSAYDPNLKNYNVGVEANDILTGMQALGIERALFIGTSRGGLILHVLAAIRPEVLAGIVLNDIGPVLEPAGLQNIKDYLAKAPRPRTLAEAVAVQRETHGAAFSALDGDDWQRMVKAIYRQDGETLIPDFDPGLLSDLATMDTSKPLPDMWPQYAAFANIPVMAIRGANSLLLSAATLDEMGRRHPDFHAITVAGQGHAPFLETGDLPQRIAAFLDRAEATPTMAPA